MQAHFAEQNVPMPRLGVRPQGQETVQELPAPECASRRSCPIQPLVGISPPPNQVGWQRRQRAHVEAVGRPDRRQQRSGSDPQPPQRRRPSRGSAATGRDVAPDRTEQCSPLSTGRKPNVENLVALPSPAHSPNAAARVELGSLRNLRYDHTAASSAATNGHVGGSEPRVSDHRRNRRDHRRRERRHPAVPPPASYRPGQHDHQPEARQRLVTRAWVTLLT